MRLSAIPKAMGIPDLCKGFHPYFFYDLNYEGEMIDKKYFDMSNMDEKTKTEFEKWYLEKSKIAKYKFREEMYYSISLSLFFSSHILFPFFILNSLYIIK